MKNNKIFMTASLANGACFSMILPILAPLIRQIHMSELQAGLLVSAGALLMSIAAIWISKKHEFQNIYKLLSIGFVGMALTWGLFTGVLAYGLYAHISVGLFFVLLFLARASTGVFMAMPQIALQTYVMSQFSEEQQRSQNMAKFGALNSMGLILGPLLTTLLLGWGILTPLWAAIVLLSCISVYIFIQFDHSSTTTNHSTDNKISKKQNIDDPHIDKNESLNNTLPFNKDDQSFAIRNSLIWLILGFSVYLAIVTLNLTAGFYIQDHFKMSIQQSAIYFSQCSLIVGISLVTVQILISKYFKWSIQRLLSIGICSMLLGLVISIYTNQMIVFQLAYILYGISVACLIPAFTTGASQSVPQDAQAKIAGLCTATQALSFVFGPVLSTGLYQMNQQFPYIFLIVMFITLSLYFLASQYSKRSIAV